MIDFCKNFASHIDSSKKEKDHYHKRFKELPVDIHVAHPILPSVFYEKPPFPTRIKEHFLVTGIMNKSERRTYEPEDLIKVDPQVAMVKDLVTNDVSDSKIIFCGISTNIVTAKNKSPISGTPIVSIKIG